MMTHIRLERPLGMVVRMAGCAFVAAAMMAFPSQAETANPNQIAAGRDLFVRDFSAKPLDANGDGLGPVFNEASCVACHNQGGVGGAGGVAANARSLGLKQAEMRGPAIAQTAPERRDEMVTQAVKQFSPGFVTPRGAFNASFALHRRGGSPAHTALRERSLSRFNPDWNNDEKLSTDTVHAERTSQMVRSPDNMLALDVQVHARNPTALFGAGLIDQIPDSAILNAAKRQTRDKHVSGRPATLDDRRIGKFGWRGNFASLIDFNASACAAELGLQSERFEQPGDVAQPGYRNPRADLESATIEAMNAFVANLPRPEQAIPSDVTAARWYRHGERLFTNVGCAQCHQPDMGQVTGLYSDLLLHEMGYESVDTASAPSFKTNIHSETRVVSVTLPPRAYYGDPVLMVQPVETGGKSVRREGNSYAHSLIPSEYPPATAIVATGKAQRHTKMVPRQRAPGLQTGTRDDLFEETIVTQEVLVATNQPTRVNQEWRTPPLWGVADSAPYMHDGRAATLLEAISMHGGEGEWSRNRFSGLSLDDQQAVIDFLNTLVAPRSGVLPVPPRHLVSSE